MTIEWIKKYPEAKWNLDKVIQNQNIVIEDFPIIMKLFNMRIDDFSLNPNLTLKYIQENKEKLDFKKMSLNLFNGIYHKNYQQIQLKRKQLKTYGQELIEKTWHPLRFIDWCLDLDLTRNSLKPTRYLIMMMEISFQKVYYYLYQLPKVNYKG